MPRIYGYSYFRDTEDDFDPRCFSDLSVPEEHIYTDNAGAECDRGFLHELIDKLKKEDVLFIRCLDDLGTSYADIRDAWMKITDEKQAELVVLDTPSLDTRGLTGDSRVRLLAAVDSVMSYVSEKAELSRQRHLDGIRRARLNGVTLGRPKCEVPANFEYVKEQYLAGEISVTGGSRMCGLSRSTFYRKVTNKS